MAQALQIGKVAPGDNPDLVHLHGLHWYQEL